MSGASSEAVDSGINTSIKPGGSSPTTTDPHVGEKRPRRGEGTIADPAAISLHHTDFVWDTMFLNPDAGSSTKDGEEEAVAKTHRAFLEAYLRTMMGALERTVANPLPLSTSPQGCTTTGSVPSSSSSSTAVTPPPVTQEVENTSWDQHYTRNLNQFFPYKNYLVKAFPDLERIITRSSGEGTVSLGERDRRPTLVMECGCGTGSALLPIVHYSSPASARFIAFDISPKAVEVFQKHPIVEEFLGRSWSGVGSSSTDSSHAPNAFLTFPFNISTKGTNLDADHVAKIYASSTSLMKGPSPWVPQSVDLLLLIFTLCAMGTVDDMHLALRRLRYWLRPGTWIKEKGSGGLEWRGGKLLFRDYGMFDHNMFRFSAKSSASECNLQEGELFCKKADGTTQFFFDMSFTNALFEAAGFVCIHLDYHCNTVKNRKTGVSMHKVFVNGEFGVLESSTASP